MIIGIDFDGTCVTHDFPRVGKEIGAAPVLKALTDAGHQLILFTMRSHRKHGVAPENSLGYENPSNIVLETDVLQDAIDWFKKHNIPLYGINENPTQKEWTDSPKAYCHLYIDNAALGIPLIYDTEVSIRPYVNWDKVNKLLNTYLNG